MGENDKIYIVARDISKEGDNEQKWMLCYDSEKKRMQFTNNEAREVVKGFLASYPKTCIVVAKLIRLEIEVEFVEAIDG